MNDKLINKIRALRNKAEDHSVTEEEAALYAAKVQELLAEHGLSMSHLAEEKRDDHVEHQKFEMMYADPWRMALFRSAEKLYFCQSFVDTWLDEKADKYRKGRTIIGRPHNVITLTETYAYLETTTLRLAREYARDNPTMAETPRALRLGFERGCGTRLGERLYKLYQDQLTPVVSANPNNLPALYKTELEIVQNYAQKNFNLVKKRGSSSSINTHGQAGRRAADGVSLSTQVGSTKGNLLR